MIIRVAILIAFALGLAACTKPTQRTASTGAQKYTLKGKVVSADRAKQKVTIAHEEISGYMEAMTMPFTLTEDWVYEQLKPGAAISAVLVVDQGMSWLEEPTVTTVSDPIAGRAEETGVEPAVGAAVPDFTLINQAGKPLRLSQYRGKTLVLTFIYTRCPLPDYCPLMTDHFGAISQALAQDAQRKDKVQLLSITVDPAYDTPAKLKEYGMKNKANFNQWQFATGSAAEIKNIAEYFGLQYWPENDQIIHGLRTAVISPDGKVVKTLRGNEWKPEDVLKSL